MLDELSPTLLYSWQEFYRHRPGIEDVANYGLAQVSLMIANANRDPRKRSAPFRLNEFLIDFAGPEDEIETLSLHDRMCAFVAATQANHGGKHGG